jgi:hypothetical protein
MRLCAGLTVVGGMLVIAGLATVLVGETSRLAGGRGWHPIVVVAEILVVGGMACGAGLCVVFAAWRVSARWRRQPPVAATRAPPRFDMAGPHLLLGRLRQSWRSAPVAEPWPVDSADFSLLDGPDSTARIAPPQPARESAHQPATPDRTERKAPRGPAGQQMMLIKDLYREAEQMGDAEFDAHWEDLRRLQHEPTRRYSEQTGLGSADVGQGAS